MIACKMAASGKVQVLSLYRMLLRESEKFSAYNYRTYALRRVKDAFKENKNVEDPQNLQRLLSQAWDSLALIQRQVTIGKMYETQKTVVETGFKKTL
ncbi:LYR motif-containing protein 4 [Clupea harengus]|uniref:LYR motif-containing protein 4 n=1 Tax=Clupea harengus TaxID=7950 RepID=A0A6P8GXJ6_CLUHA|nr:LYR motif-containing protein 4 [Clupea harengus]